ncbi:hypothetical protein FDP41_012573 [Naegleria fowleri]|uniref:Uncharacterized protein n=1 Tax=Naegleria fowleri TaxID=5763 RepID=A0A6A5BT97_NAEFO|nr:uncharacterized protein FDP41_012573 [Naegleria fowleri]KAF0981313.1 hypothetical protein FDP41_012573 [Naegleria fowleri]
MNESSSKNSSSKKNFHTIELKWMNQIESSIVDSSTRDADVMVQVSSRKIKNQEESPNNILFRTHHYEFRLEPNQSFFKLKGNSDTSSRFFVELKLLKNLTQMRKRKTPPNSLSSSLPSSLSSESSQSNYGGYQTGTQSLSSSQKEEEDEDDSALSPPRSLEIAEENSDSDQSNEAAAAAENLLSICAIAQQRNATSSTSIASEDSSSPPKSIQPQKPHSLFGSNSQTNAVTSSSPTKVRVASNLASITTNFNNSNSAKPTTFIPPQIENATSQNSATMKSSQGIKTPPPIQPAESMFESFAFTPPKKGSKSQKNSDTPSKKKRGGATNNNNYNETSNGSDSPGTMDSAGLVDSSIPFSPFDDIINSVDPNHFTLSTTNAQGMEEEFREFSIGNDEVPVITYSFTEDLATKSWVVELFWPTEKKALSWRGKFCFYISIFRKDMASRSYKLVMSKISSQFAVFSKPDVYLKKIKSSTTKDSKKSESKEPKKKKGGKNSKKETVQTVTMLDGAVAQTSENMSPPPKPHHLTPGGGGGDIAAHPFPPPPPLQPYPHPGSPPLSGTPIRSNGLPPGATMMHPHQQQQMTMMNNTLPPLNAHPGFQHSGGALTASNHMPLPNPNQILSSAHMLQPPQLSPSNNPNASSIHSPPMMLVNPSQPHYLAPPYNNNNSSNTSGIHLQPSTTTTTTASMIPPFSPPSSLVSTGTNSQTEKRFNSEIDNPSAINEDMSPVKKPKV